MEGEEGIQHSHHGNKSEEAGRDLADAIAKVEQADGEAAEDDGEVKPGEKGALVGEEDLGLDACGEGDALAWGVLVVGGVNNEETGERGEFAGVGSV